MSLTTITLVSLEENHGRGRLVSMSDTQEWCVEESFKFDVVNVRIRRLRWDSSKLCEEMESLKAWHSCTWTHLSITYTLWTTDSHSNVGNILLHCNCELHAPKDAHLCTRRTTHGWVTESYCALIELIVLVHALWNTYTLEWGDTRWSLNVQKQFTLLIVQLHRTHSDTQCSQLLRG